MPLCEFGSERNPAAPVYIHIDPLNMTGLLPSAASWLLPYLPFLSPIDLSVDDFCELEPPELPEITASDLFGLIGGGGVGVAFLAGQKLAQLVHCYLWYRLCRCTAAFTPAAPAAPSAPADLPAINPPAYAPAPAAAACASTSGSQTGFSGTFPVAVLPTTRLPANWSAIRVRYTSAVVGAQHVSLQTFMQLLGHSGLVLATYDFNSTPPLDFTHDFFQVSGVTDIRVTTSVTLGGVSSDSVAIAADVYCAGASPGSLVASCCPPDPNLLSALARLESAVTLIQRQLAPFAYVEGSVTTGLSGDGEIAIQGVLGYRVDCTTIPDRAGLEAGTPTTRSSLGWIRTGYPSGWGERKWIDLEALVVAPVLGDATRVGYSLTPGVEISITELLREP